MDQSTEIAWHSKTNPIFFGLNLNKFSRPKLRTYIIQVSGEHEKPKNNIREKNVQGPKELSQDNARKKCLAQDCGYHEPQQ